jgi:thiol-disulfide isomerase/thioredoxin
MRRALLAVLLVPLLAACGSHAPSLVAPGPGRVDVGNKELVAFKSRTDIPGCPRVTSTGVDGGLPAVTLPCLGGGRSVDVAGLRGPMIVNFWASWCHACRQEMPALASYARSQSTVRVLGIDYLDAQPGAALQLASDSKVGYPLIADPASRLDHASPLPHISGLPFTAFIDAGGKIVHLEAGALTSRSDVATAAQQYLGVGG